MIYIYIYIYTHLSMYVTVPCFPDPERLGEGRMEGMRPGTSHARSHAQG